MDLDFRTKILSERGMCSFSYFRYKACIKQPNKVNLNIKMISEKSSTKQSKKKSEKNFSEKKFLDPRKFFFEKKLFTRSCRAFFSDHFYILIGFFGYLIWVIYRKYEKMSKNLKNSTLMFLKIFQKLTECFSDLGVLRPSRNISINGSGRF